MFHKFRLPFKPVSVASLPSYTDIQTLITFFRYVMGVLC